MQEASAMDGCSVFDEQKQKSHAMILMQGGNSPGTVFVLRDPQGNIENISI